MKIYKEKHQPIMPVLYTYSSSFVLLGAAGDTALWAVFRFKPEVSSLITLHILMGDKYQD